MTQSAVEKSRQNARGTGLSCSGLKGRLILAFVFVATLIAVSGGAGLFFVNRMGATIQVFSNVASPLLIQASGLVENVQKTTIAVLEATNQSSSSGSAQAEIARIAQLSAEGERGLAALRALSGSTNLDLQVEAVTRLHADFIRTSQDMIASWQKEISATTVVNQQFAAFEKERQALDEILASLIRQTEETMVTAEDQAKIKVQTQEATIEWLGGLFSETMTETYPALQQGYKLVRDLIGLQEIAKTYINAPAADKLAAIEKRAGDNFKSTSTVMRRLAGRMRTEEGKTTLAQLTQAFTKLESATLGNGGLFAGTARCWTRGSRCSRTRGRCNGRGTPTSPR